MAKKSNSGRKSGVQGKADAAPPENECVMPKVRTFFMDRDRVNMFLWSAITPLIFLRAYTWMLQSCIMLMVSNTCYRLESGRILWLVNSGVYMVSVLLVMGYLILYFIWRIFE